MKVFGGNGRKTNNLGSGAEISRSSGTGRNNINDANIVYNNTDASRKPVPPQKPKKKGVKGILIALLVIVIIAAVAVAYWEITTRAPETESNRSDPQAPDAIAQTDANRYYTLLVVGIDQIKANTDTIMVVRYDTVENKANIVSIPRDTLVNVPSKYKKINSVYSIAEGDGKSGIDALMDAVKGVCGFRPDNYVCIDTQVFVKAIDALGGVYFDVPIDMNYEDYSDNDNDGVFEYVFTINVKKGYQLLNGQNALGVFRFRHNNDGSGYPMQDLDRIETQHGLIKAVASQALQLKNLTKLVEIAKMVTENCETNLTSGNMQWYAQEFLKMSMDGISLSTIPTTGSYINNLSYVTINADDWIKMINESINPLKTEIGPKDCNILCQKNPEPGKYVITPGNYFSTNGDEVYTNFYKNTQ